MFLPHSQYTGSLCHYERAHQDNHLIMRQHVLVMYNSHVTRCGADDDDNGENGGKAFAAIR